MNAVPKSEDLTHYRKVFDSPYLSSADIVEPTRLTISHVTQEIDRTKKTKDFFNTAHFVERELRPGEKLKPMILNATNSKVMDKIVGSPFIEDWTGVAIIVYVDHNVRFGKETVEGLRLQQAPNRQSLTPAQTQGWENAKAAFIRDGNLKAVLARVDMSEEHQRQLIDECKVPEPEQEPLARMLYEEMFYCEVGNGGFFDFGLHGDSPDGLIGDDGVIEIKCVIASTHHDTIKRGKFDPAYKWQIAGHFDSGRKWVDFVSYCGDYTEWNQLAVFRTYREELEREIAMLHERRVEFLALVDEKQIELNDRKQAA